VSDLTNTVRTLFVADTGNLTAGLTSVSGTAQRAAQDVARIGTAGQQAAAGGASVATAWERVSPMLQDVIKWAGNASVALVAAMTAGVHSAGEWAHEIGETADMLGIAKERAEAFTKVAGLHGIDPQSAGLGLMQITKFIDAALGGDEKKASLLQRIGLDPETVRREGEDSLETAGRVLKALSALKGNERLSFMAEAGLSPRMMKMLKMSDLAGDMAAQQASPTFMSDAQLKDLDEADMAWRKLKASIASTARLIWADAAPAFTAFYDALRPIVGFVAELVKAHPHLVQATLAAAGVMSLVRSIGLLRDAATAARGAFAMLLAAGGTEGVAPLATGAARTAITAAAGSTPVLIVGIAAAAIVALRELWFDGKAILGAAREGYIGDRQGAAWNAAHPNDQVGKVHGFWWNLMHGHNADAEQKAGQASSYFRAMVERDRGKAFGDEDPGSDDEDAGPTPTSKLAVPASITTETRVDLTTTNQILSEMLAIMRNANGPNGNNPRYLGADLRSLGLAA
jgi:hypothetical protein